MSNRTITENFSGSEKVRNWLLVTQPHHYCLMTVALSIVTPIITGGLGPAAQYGVNALPEPELLQYCIGRERSHITHLLTHFFRVEKYIVSINICHYLTKSKFLTFLLPEVFNFIILFEMITESHNFKI